MVSKNSSACPELNEFTELSQDLKELREEFFKRLGFNVVSSDRGKLKLNILVINKKI